MYVPPVMGKAAQLIREPSDEDLQLVSEEQKTYIQAVVGVFLFYSRAVDPTMLTTINKISSDQSHPTQTTMRAVERFLGYAKRYPNSHIRISESNMQMQVQSDASYLSESNARSRAGGVLYFGLRSDGSINGAVDNISCIIPTAVSSAAEAEYAALFLVGKEATSARHTLQDLGYPQPATTILCDNSCAVGIATRSVKQKRSKAIDMRYHWIRDQVYQNKFKVIWGAGKHNLADYFTKSHPVQHFAALRNTFVFTPKGEIRECARTRRIARKISANALSKIKD